MGTSKHLLRQKGREKERERERERERETKHIKTHRVRIKNTQRQTQKHAIIRCDTQPQ